jgi:catechol 2,3-dioxygenase-like lactoylglutathione lyase family enzyme
MSDFSLGGLGQVIHVTDDLPRARRLYGDVFGGECYYEGYSPYEKRDASIYAIGDLTIEPMAPSAEPGAIDLPVGRFLTRFGPRFQSVAVCVSGVNELAEHLQASGVRVVGPGGVALADLPADGPRAIYSHPRQSHFLIEFVDFDGTGSLMPGNPRRAAGWDPGRWEREHPLGFTGDWHLTALVKDVDAALGFFTGVLGTPVLADVAATSSDRRARIGLGTELVVELFQPLDETSDAARSLATDGEGLGALSLSVRNLDAAADHLAAHGLSVAARTDSELVVDRLSTAGADLRLVEA